MIARQNIHKKTELEPEITAKEEFAKRLNVATDKTDKSFSQIFLMRPINSDEMKRQISKAIGNPTSSTKARYPLSIALLPRL